MLVYAFRIFYTQSFHACLQGDQIGIAPQMFKALVGRGHPEFSTNRQQDAQEFLLHFINMVEVQFSSCSLSLFSVLSCSSFILVLFSFSNRGIVALGQTRLKPSGFWWRRRLCVSSPRKLSTPSGWITSSSCLCPWIMLPMLVCGSGLLLTHSGSVAASTFFGIVKSCCCFPTRHLFILTEELQEAERRREEGDTSAPTVRAQIPFTACMAALSEPEILTDFWSSAVQAKTTATKYKERQPHTERHTETHLANIEIFVSFVRTTRFASFPDHLVIQIKKFTFGLDWVPKKLGKRDRKEVPLYR